MRTEANSNATPLERDAKHTQRRTMSMADAIEAAIEARFLQEAAQGAAISEEKSLILLYLLNQRSVVDRSEIEPLVNGYNDWRAVWKVVQAGWALDDKRGLVITDIGRDLAKAIFKTPEEVNMSSQEPLVLDEILVPAFREWLSDNIAHNAQDHSDRG